MMNSMNLAKEDDGSQLQATTKVADSNGTTARAVENPNPHPVDERVQGQYLMPTNKDKDAVGAKADLMVPAESEANQASNKRVDQLQQKVADSNGTTTTRAVENPNPHPVDERVQGQYLMPTNKDKDAVGAKADLMVPAKKSEANQASNKRVDQLQQKVTLPGCNLEAPSAVDEKKKLELKEESRKAKWKLKLEYACFVVLLGSSELVCIMFLTENSVNKRIVTAIRILGFWVLISGLGLLIHTFMLAPSMSNASTTDPIHVTISKALTVMSYTSLVVTSLPLSFLPKPYNLLTIIVLVAVLLTLGANVYLRLRSINGRTDLRDPTLYDKQMKEMTRLSELSQVVVSLSSGGLVGLLFGIHTNASNHAHHPTVPITIFLTFASFILGTFLMFFSQKNLIHLSSSTRVNFLRFGMGLCMILLGFLAIVALAIASTFLKLFTPMVFIPVLFVYLVWKIMDQYRIEDSVDEEEIKEAYTKGNKVTSISFGGILAIFSGYLGASSSDKSMHLNIIMVFMASAFLLGLTLMFFSYKPSSTRPQTGAIVRILSYFAIVPVIFGVLSIVILDFVQL